MNKINLLGTIVKDIELRHTTSDMQVANFTLAVKRKVKNKDGNYDSDFVNCVAYGKLGETISKFFKKGSRILIDGELRNNNYENKKGEKVYSTNVVVNDIDFIDKLEKKTEEESNPYKAMGEKVENDIEMPF